MKGDAAYFERHFAPEYTYSNNFGVLFSRTENLNFLRTFATKPPYKILANTSDNVKVNVNGNAALVTADWATTALPIGDPNAEPHTDTGLNAIYEMQLKNRAQRLKIMDMIDGSFGAGVMEGYAKTPYTEIWQYTNVEVSERMKIDAEGYLAEVQVELVANKLNRMCLEYGFGKYTLAARGDSCTDPNQVAVWSQKTCKLSRPISPGDIFLASYNGKKQAWMYMPKGCVAIQCDMPG
ncbi:MAG: nuclear transport factor 2 family protein [Anaerolineae bacterium]|nr:nuclear transport factor 2 family protein [Gloeobacterales cyanobacterium ES-bin-313]